MAFCAAHFAFDNTGELMLVTILIFICVSIFFLLPRKVKKYSTTLPGVNYKLCYSDKDKTLTSEKYNITGRPDYVYKHRLTGMLIPIELKSGCIKNKNMPRLGDLMQLAAYFILLEECFGVKPRFGYVAYKDFMFQIPNDKQLRRSVLKKVSAMRQMISTKHIAHRKDKSVCKNCVYYHVCDVR